MSTQEEVIRVGKKLEKLISGDKSGHSSACDLLKVLKGLPITLEVLQKTRIGVTVNNFRKASKDEEAINLAKAVIKAWKKLVPESSSSSSGGGSGGQGDAPGRRISSASARSISSDRGDESGSSQPPGQSMDAEEGGSTEPSKHHRARSDSVQSGGDSPAAATPAEASGEESPRRRESTDEPGMPLSPTSALPSVEVDETRDPTRLKCRDMLAAALRTPPMVDNGGDCDILAAEIEHFVFKQFDNTEMKYKNRIRSRIANLKDGKNPRLRENVLLGHISPKHFSMMTPEEMASDEMRKLRDKLSKEAFNDHQMSTTSGTKSDLFKCGRCGKRDTTYTQLQTRSSDEPMTTFVLCNNCGYRWKFC